MATATLEGERMLNAPPTAGLRRKSIRTYLKRNPKLVAGVIIFACLLAFSFIGPLFVDTKGAQPMAAMPAMAPTTEYPFGTDDQGRNLLAVAVVGLPLTLEVGLIAGAVAIVFGTLLGLTAGYVGGWIDLIIRGVCDILLTVPGLVVLITVAASIKGSISVELMALIVAALAWMWPARTIRSQVLSLRERAYIQMAKLSGMRTDEIILREIMPNLLPYLAASFVGSVAAAILASVGLEALGLGPQNEPTLGMTIYWSITFNAVIRGMWWWLVMPIVLIVLLLVSLFLMSAGLDEIANPRLRKVEA
ncbi:MAG TPA: ABC transporter permease [Thermomicrobiales bacterium]|nr:ABC transporter permease [Thermomicrobiales bacterium]